LLGKLLVAATKTQSFSLRPSALANFPLLPSNRRQLRRKRTGAKNPVVDYESPEEFIMAHAIWQKAGMWRARVTSK
jgi:hypothetical protein